jgi:NAD(P)H-nitrite reductase large subunit
MELPQTISITEDCAGACRSCATVGSCPERVICQCLAVTEEALIGAIVTLGLRTVKDVRTATEAGDGCTCCHKELAVYLAVYAPAASSNMCSAK